MSAGDGGVGHPLFEHVAAAYSDSDDGRLDNASLYRMVAERAGIPESKRRARSPIGRTGQLHSPVERAIRWHTQTLKHMGAIRRVDGERGVWELVERTRQGLHVPAVPVKLVAFSTALGVAIWGDNRGVIANLDEPIHLVLTSPPYPLRKPRAYGNVPVSEYVDFIVHAIEPLVRTLVRGGSMALNLSNDVFMASSPARSTYLERLIIALEDRLGLQLMDRLPWVNLSKAPGPIAWASKERIHLNVGFEPIIWMCNAPRESFADNRRVLEPHTEKHRQLIAAGGTAVEGDYSDGAYRRRAGAFGRETAGRIPKNVLMRGHRCADAMATRRDAQRLGLPPHGAVMPTSVADFLVRYLTEPGQLVVDPFGGKGTTGLAAERAGRRWLICDRVLDYLRAGAERFRAAPGFEMPEAVEHWPRAA
ncbi:DNA methyltransferase [Rhodanobacter sp. FW510-R12]|uniref:site-specific DNA-methyltransferase n=1 Tax=Rhodanobacter thiooxydans TaxID=416169 RepID=UPI0009237138|nr:site-specific DNA-methyltransferase [Rhodanobacter thiooxydans]UJJ56693.1 site-specific DNA-methyltransferase [Rhodanobacter thiooxydans]